MLGNELFWQECNHSVFQHLVRDGSDHASLNISYKSEMKLIKKPFHFLNFWTKHQSFKQEVNKSCEMAVGGSTFKILNEKLRRLKHALIKWSKATYGDFFKTNCNIERYCEDEGSLAGTRSYRGEQSRAQKK